MRQGNVKKRGRERGEIWKKKSRKNGRKMENRRV
jgi:hypothetical protein